MSQGEPMNVDQQDQRIRCTIPERKFVQIDYPGNVRNIDRALETLGGEKEITNALENKEESLKLNYRPSDPFSHPIHGNIMQHAGLAVKVTRRKKKNQPDGEATYKAEILGTVVKVCRFRALSDFQYIVPRDDPIRQLRTAMEKGDANVLYNYRITKDDNSIPFQRIPPPLFCARQAPSNYKYQQNAPVVRVKVRLRDGSYAIRLVTRKTNEEYNKSLLVYDEPVSTSTVLPFDKLSKEERQVAEKIAKLFEERPIWTRIGIKTRLDVEEYKYLRRALVANAYSFRSGPWRECWIKYGIDPRTDPSYNIYQHLDARRVISAQERSSVQAHRRRKMRFLPNSLTRPSEAANESRNEITEEDPNAHIFDGVTARPLVTYLLCDIVDPDVTPIINNPKYLKPNWTKVSGWYYSCAYERIRMVVRRKLEEFAQKGKATPYPNILEGLDALVEKEKGSAPDETKQYEIIDHDVAGGRLASQEDDGENQEDEAALRIMGSLNMLRDTQGIGEDIEDFDALEEYDIDELIAAEEEEEEEEEDGEGGVEEE